MICYFNDYETCINKIYYVLTTLNNQHILLMGTDKILLKNIIEYVHLKLNKHIICNDRVTHRNNSCVATSVENCGKALLCDRYHTIYIILEEDRR